MAASSRLASNRPIALPIYALALVCAFATALATGCAGSGATLQALAVGAGNAQAVITTPGAARIAFHRTANQPPWASLALVAAGNTSVRRIDLHPGTRAALLQAPPSAFTPFGLLPRESFSLSADTSTSLRGLFLWEMPHSLAAIEASLRRRINVDWNTTRGLLLNVASGNSRFELTCSSPAPHAIARIGLDLTDPARVPQIWLSLNNNAWSRLPAPHERDTWEEPYDISKYIRGQRTFQLRFLFPPADPTAQPIPPLILRQLRIEREVGLDAQFRKFSAATTEVPISTASGSGPLQVSLLAAE